MSVSRGTYSETEQDAPLSLSLQEGEVLISSEGLYFFHLACVPVVATEEMQPPAPAPLCCTQFLMAVVLSESQFSVKCLTSEKTVM